MEGGIHQEGIYSIQGMIASVYRFQWAHTQSTVFRGCVKMYKENKIFTDSCLQIRNTKKQALQDAHKLKSKYENNK